MNTPIDQYQLIYRTASELYLIVPYGTAKPRKPITTAVWIGTNGDAARAELDRLNSPEKQVPS